MSKKLKKILSLVAVLAIMATMVLGAYSYFTDYATQSVKTKAGTFDIALDHSIDLDGTIDIINPGDVAAFDFTVTNTAEKSADVYAVVTVTATPKTGVTVNTASPYKLLLNGSAVNFADNAEVGVDGTTFGSVAKSADNLVYTYTLPVKALAGSIEKDATIDGNTVNNFKYEYELGMDIDALNEWEDSTVDVQIEIYAKQHRNTSHANDLAVWKAAVEADVSNTDPIDAQKTVNP